MTLADRQLARQKRIHDSMIQLAMDSRFADFIATVADCRESALDNLTDGSVIQNERASLACIGEIAAYKSLLRSFDEAKANAESRVEDTATD